MGTLKGRLEGEVELRSSGDLYHEMFSTKPHHVSLASPKHCQGCNLHEGEFGKPGSIISWDYTIDGKACVGKQCVETIDEENKTIVFKMLEGDLMNDYKNFVITLKVTPNADGLDLVNWKIEYETIHEEIPYPTYILNLLLNLTRDIEYHHLQA